MLKRTQTRVLVATILALAASFLIAACESIDVDDSVDDVDPTGYSLCRVEAEKDLYECRAECEPIEVEDDDDDDDTSYPSGMTAPDDDDDTVGDDDDDDTMGDDDDDDTMGDDDDDDDTVGPISSCEENLCLYGPEGCELTFYERAVTCGKKYNTTDDSTYSRDKCFRNCDAGRAACVSYDCDDIEHCEEAFDNCKYAC
jgi:hypothetical protein